jgi:hypothetical protein
MVRSLAALSRRAAPVALAGERLLPAVPALAAVLPGGGLRRGSTVAVTGSTSLALALAASPSAAGSWAAAIGTRDLGLVAAAELGVALDRFAVVPDAGRDRWATVVAALLDAVDVVLAWPEGRVRAADARRLAARARERGSVLVACGRPWLEGTDVRLTAAAITPMGLGHGDGRLTTLRIEVEVDGRGRAARPRRTLLTIPHRADHAILPAPAGEIACSPGGMGQGEGAAPAPAAAVG